MKKFIFKCIIFFIILALLITPFYIRIVYNSGKANRDNFLFAQIDKQNRLKSTMSIQAQRIIFLSGSSLAFSFDSQKAENALQKVLKKDVSVTNMGLHAGFGILRMMENTLPFLRKGDILILCPEYTQFSEQNAFGDVHAWYLEIDVLNKPFHKIRRQGFLEFPSNFRSWCVRNLWAPLAASSIEYSRKNFNEYGDVIGHLSIDFKNKEDVKPYKGKPAPYKKEIIALFIKYIKLMQQMGVKIIFSYPPFQEASYNNYKEHIKELDYYLRSVLPVDFIGTAEDYIVGNDCLFDTPYHTNAKGREKRTNQAIKDLTEYCEKEYAK